MKRVAASSASFLGLVVALAGSGACGYRPVRGGDEPATRLSVAAAPAGAPDAEAAQGLLSGARAELGREGVLESPTGYPRLVVELVRVDVQAAAVAARDGAPAARAVSVAVVARGWVQDAAGAAPTRVTGDLRRAVVAPEGSASPEAAALRRDAARQAAEAAGRALTRHVLGIPTARE